jgi:hypothetical protein
MTSALLSAVLHSGNADKSQVLGGLTVATKEDKGISRLVPWQEKSNMLTQLSSRFNIFGLFTSATFPPPHPKLTS